MRRGRDKVDVWPATTISRQRPDRHRGSRDLLGSSRRVARVRAVVCAVAARVGASPALRFLRPIRATGLPIRARDRAAPPPGPLGGPPIAPRAPPVLSALGKAQIKKTIG